MATVNRSPADSLLSDDAWRVTHHACVDLFARPSHESVQLFDDAEGGARYWPSIVSPDVAHAWFETLMALEWQSMRRPMYDREVDVPRLLFHRRLDDPACPSLLGDILREVRARVDAPFSAAGLNLYRDGRDSVAMHGDKLHQIRGRQPIAIVSLGNVRRMNIRARGGARERIAIDLAPGSLLVMSHASQSTHEHGVPKTARPVGPRMSVVYRVRP